MVVSRPAWLAVSLAALIAAAQPAAAQRGQDGALAGAVFDTSGAALVGATVVASSPQQIGGPRSTATDAAGRYRFALLSPGDFTVEASLAGFKTIRVEPVQVPPGLTITLDLPLALASMTETVAVAARPAPIDVTSAASPAALERVLVDTLPLSRDVQTFVNLVPGVTEAVAFGGSARANPFTVDGASGNEPGWGTPTTPFSRTWMEEVQFVGPGAQAQHGEFTGIAMNAVTRSGSDRYTGLLEFRGTPGSWTANNRGGLSTALAEAFRPQEVVERWEAIGQAGGPVLRERLWFFAGAQHYRDDTRSAAFGTDSRRADEPVPSSTNRRAIGKVTGALATTGRLEGFAARNLEDGHNLGAGPLVSPEATFFNDRTDDVWNLRFAWAPGTRWMLEVRHGGNHRDGVSGAAADRRNGPPPHLDLFTDAYSVNAGFYDRWNSYVHITSAAVTGYLNRGAAGSHDVRAGVEYERANLADSRSTPGGLLYLDYDGQPYQVEIWEGATYRGQHGRSTAYVQDSWSLAPVTIDVGLRADLYRADPVYPARYRTHSMAPRLGVAWDIGRRHDTVLRAHYGRYYDPMVTSYYDFLDPLASAPSITAEVVGPNQFVELSRFLPTTGYDIDPDIRPSYVAELLGGIEHALPGKLVVKAQVIDRRFKDTASFVDTASVWEPLEVRDPGPDGRVGTADDAGLVTIYNNTNPGAAYRVLTNPPQAYRRYRALQVIGSRRAARGATFQASYTWSRTRGNFNNTFSSNAANAENGVNGVFLNPNRAINREGATGLDFSHSFKALGAWLLPGRWTASGVYRVESGRRWARQVRYVSGLNQGFENVLAEPFIRRTPTINVADVRIEKTFRLGATTAGAYADVFNLTNAGVARTYINQSGPLFEQPSSWLDPRTFTLGLRLSF